MAVYVVWSQSDGLHDACLRTLAYSHLHMHASQIGLHDASCLEVVQLLKTRRTIISMGPQHDASEEWVSPMGEEWVRRVGEGSG